MKARGWRVFGTVRRQADVVELTKASRGMIEPLLMDVTHDEAVAQAIATVEARAGRLDALVNNAGIAVGGAVEQLPTRDLVRQFEVNLFGVHRVTRAALPMLRRSRGRIVMVSSMAGEDTFPFNGFYSASKHALEAMSDALRIELHGVVKVIIVQPGSVLTPIWAKSTDGERLAEADENYPADEIARITRYYRRVGEHGLPAQRVAEVIANALELPWPPTRWPVLARNAWPMLLLRHLPTFLADRLKRKALRWPPTATQSK